MLGDRDPAQHGFTIHGHDIDLIYADHPWSFLDRLTIVRKRFRPDVSGVIQIDVPPGSGTTAIANFMHVFHNLPGCAPNKPPLPNLPVIAEDTAVTGVYTASFWGNDWAIQRTRRTLAGLCSLVTTAFPLTRTPEVLRHVAPLPLVRWGNVGRGANTSTRSPAA